jgi:hypothetical protein
LVGSAREVIRVLDQLEAGGGGKNAYKKYIREKDQTAVLLSPRSSN